MSLHWSPYFTGHLTLVTLYWSPQHCSPPSLTSHLSPHTGHHTSVTSHWSPHPVLVCSHQSPLTSDLALVTPHPPWRPRAVTMSLPRLQESREVVGRWLYPHHATPLCHPHHATPRSRGLLGTQLPIWGQSSKNKLMGAVWGAGWVQGVAAGLPSLCLPVPVSWGRGPWGRGPWGSPCSLQLSWGQGPCGITPNPPWQGVPHTHPSGAQAPVTG